MNSKYFSVSPKIESEDEYFIFPWKFAENKLSFSPDYAYNIFDKKEFDKIIADINKEKYKINGSFFISGKIIKIVDNEVNIRNIYRCRYSSSNGVCEKSSVCSPDGYELTFPTCYEHLTYEDSLSYSEELKTKKSICPICYDELLIPGKVYKTSCCENFFCKICILKWDKSSCPICRSDESTFSDWEYKKEIYDDLEKDLERKISQLKNIFEEKRKELDSIFFLQDKISLFEKHEQVKDSIVSEIDDIGDEIFTTITFNLNIRAFSKKMEFFKQENQKKILFVKNLSNEEILRNSFSEFGKISNIQILTDFIKNIPSGNSTIEFENDESLEKALVMNGKELCGKNIQVLITNSSLKMKDEIKKKTISVRMVSDSDDDDSD